MALLNFRHGFLASLKDNAPAVEAGTVYITRDERAMYVDLPPYEGKDGVTHQAERIRIGDMRVYEYYSELTEELKNGGLNAYSTSTLFYVEKKKVDETDVTINALFKLNSNKTAFIPLNSTSDIVANLGDLTARVVTLEELTAGHTTKIEANENAIDAVEGRLDILEGDENTQGSVAYDIAAAKTTLNASIALKADKTALESLSKTVTDNAAAATTAHNTLNNAITTEKNRAIAEEGRLAGLISDNADNITTNTNAITTLNSNASTTGSVAHSVKTAVDAEATARAAAITSVQESINDINTEISSIKSKNDSQDAEIARKVNIAQGSANSNKIMIINSDGNVAPGAAVANKLTYLSGVTSSIQDQINSLSNSIGGNADSIDSLITRMDIAEDNITANDNDIANLQVAINTLNGNNTTVGSVAKAVKDAIDVEKAAREAAESALSGRIDTNVEDIGELEEKVAALETFRDTTAPNTYLNKTDASDTYLNKTDASNTYLNKTDASNTYATKAALQTTNEEVAAVQVIAEDGVSKANAAQATIDSYKISNDAAVAAIKQTADAAATAEDLTSEINRAKAAEKVNAEAISAETTRATSVEADFEARISTMEVFWDSADNSTEVVDTLKEIQEYIKSDTSGAATMAGNIQANAQAITALQGRMTTAEGEIDTLQADLAAEITNRDTAVSNAITTANSYTDAALTWTQF